LPENQLYVSLYFGYRVALMSFPALSMTVSSTQRVILILERVVALLLSMVYEVFYVCFRILRSVICNPSGFEGYWLFFSESAKIAPIPGWFKTGLPDAGRKS